MAKKFFITGIILLFASSCFAATAGNTSDPKMPYGPGIANMKASGLGPFKVGFDSECLFDKDLKGKSGISSAEIEGQRHLFKIGCTFAERIEPYVKLGISHLKTSWKQGNTQLKVKGEDAFTLGVGGKVLVYEIPEHRIRLSLDGQYLYTDLGVDNASVNAPYRSVTAAEFKIKEWQIAGIIGIELPVSYNKRDPAAIYSLVPYVGFAYFDSETDAKFTYSGTAYDLGKAENDNKFLFITGCDINAPEHVSLNIEGRWIGETAASGGLTIKF